MKYRTIVADPPWTPTLGATWKSSYRDKARPQRHYSLMTVEKIAELAPPVADQAHLYLWALAQHVDWAYVVAEAWGFDPVILWTWRKPGLGTGRFQCNTEHVLVARRGSRHGNPFGTGGRNAATTGGTCFDWPRAAHSVKPDEFYDLVERLSSGPRLELFARRQRLGWDSWGNECRCDAEMDVVG